MQCNLHMLSFDVEEYFHVEAAAASGLRAEQWDCLPRRLDEFVDAVLQMLADHAASATFFVLGWVARHEPGVLRRIAAGGHEIASHGTAHQMLHRLAPQQFRQDIADSRKLIEDVTARPVVGYRAPTFSITHRAAWALDVLAEEGFAYDSSVFPVRHDRYGVPDAPTGPHQAVGPGGGSILELPPLTLRLLGHNIPVGGGGYLRLLPIQVLGAGLRRAGRDGWPGMIYLHPWELDAAQPVLPMTTLNRFRHRVHLRRTASKLHWLLDHFRFSGVYSRLDELKSIAGANRMTYGRQEPVPAESPLCPEKQGPSYWF